MNQWMVRIALNRYVSRVRTEGWLSAAGMIVRKLVQIWYLTESGNTRAQWFLFLCFAVTAPLGLIELATWFKPADAPRFLCAITVLYWILIHILVVPLARYMLPVFPLIFLAACFRVQRLWKQRPLYSQGTIQ